ncbi:MAG: hypothetical protein AB1411_14345 [Nitrospirota bacterium]
MATPRSLWILFGAGINLILAQYWTMKEFLMVFESSEVTILLVLVAFLGSCSLGYALSPRTLHRWLPHVCTVLVVGQLFFPWLIKDLAALWYQRSLPHMTFSLLAFGTLLMAPLATVFLPYLIGIREEAAEAAEGEPLARCYAVELGGAMFGVALILTTGRTSFAALLVLYFLNLSIMLAFLFGRMALVFAGVPAAILYGLSYGPLDRAAAEDFYRGRDGYSQIEVLASTQSIYNRIDVLLVEGKEKRLLLNGREYFNPTNLEAFNRYLAGVPSLLAPGGRVLIVGTGSLSSVYHASRTARTVESVEIDEQVVGLTKDLFREFNHLDQVRGWTLHVDDAKHFLGSSQEQYDLIVIDLVPPVYVQTALLYTREFYELVKRRLSPRGVLAIYTGEWFGDPDMRRYGSSTEKTVDAVFSDYLVLNSRAADNTFVYASKDLPFSKQDLVALLETWGANGADQVFEPAQVRPLVQDRTVTSMDDLDIVLEWAPSTYRTFASFFRIWP